MFYIRQKKVTDNKGAFVEYLILDRNKPSSGLSVPFSFRTIREATEKANSLNRGYTGVVNVDPKSVSYFIERDDSSFVQQWLLDHPQYEMVEGEIRQITNPAKSEESCKQWRARQKLHINAFNEDLNLE